MRIALALLLTLTSCGYVVGDDATDLLMRHLGNRPSLVVVVCGGTEADLAMIKTLAQETPWTLFCHLTTAQARWSLRSQARAGALLGTRIYVTDGDGTALWLADDLADAVWVAPTVSTAPTDREIMRVLRPGGVAVQGDRTTIKPQPADVDEWRHPYHDPDNNVVSTDAQARLPGELRFQTQPVFAAMPTQSLFAGGRLFFFTGHIAFHEREEPLLNMLTVLNAYNGLPLWTRPLDPTYVVHNVAKFATADTLVFAEGGTLRMLDAASGAERATFAVPGRAAATGDTDWKWLAHEGNTLWAAMGPPDANVAPHRQKRRMGHWPWNVANERYASITSQFGEARWLAAFRFPEMKLLWSIREAEPFDARSLCLQDNGIFQLAPRKFLAVRDASNGSLRWRKSADESKELFDTIGDALKRQGWGIGWATYCCTRAADGVVCIAGPPFRKTIGVSLQNGDHLWTHEAESPHPFFFDDALYVMPRVAAPSAKCRRIDPKTGETIDEFDLGVIGSCTRLTATPSQFFYRPGGGEGRTVYFDLKTRKLADYEGVVRPGCFDGVVPANGRLYWLPLACDCWQIHGTFCMAPRKALTTTAAARSSATWKSPSSVTVSGATDWPLFRANAAGTATVSASIGGAVKEVWRRQLPGGQLTAPICVQGRVFVGANDGTVTAIEADSGDIAWEMSTCGAVVYPPAYCSGRLLVGSCDGVLYCADAATGRLLGQTELAPQRRFINIMGRFMSAWPLGGGVVIGDDGTVYTAAGSTAADGAVVAAIDIATGKPRWCQTYNPDRETPKLSFGVQGNLLLNRGAILINGGAPVGIVALDQATGENPRIVARLEAGMDLFLQPDDTPLSGGRELYTKESARTTIFKRHQGRIYFRTGAYHIALVDGRLFCARNREPVDRIVEIMNTDPRTGKSISGETDPWNVMELPVDDEVVWAGKTDGVVGLAVGTDGLAVLYKDRAEGISLDGSVRWMVALPSPPVPWGIALTGSQCVVTLRDGHVICLAD